jgi:dihydrofolate reductase
MKVFIIAALSADGFIARDPGQPSTAWTSAEDKKRFVALTRQARALVMGRKTFETFGSRPLKGRALFVYSRSQPAPETVPGGGSGEGTVEWTDDEPAALVRRLEARGYQELAVCGGTEIYSQFLAAGVVEELYLTVEPVLFGRGASLFNQAMQRRLELRSGQILPGGTQFLDYRLAD